MTDSPSYGIAVHEASHAIAALELGCPVTYVSIRQHEDSSGRTKFDTASEGFSKLDPLTCAVIKCAGEVGQRMAAGATRPEFNWFADGGDAEDARYFVARAGGDELGNRRLAALKAYALLRARWEVVEEIAGLFQRNKTILGEDVERIWLAERARRGASARAAKPPEPSPPKPKPAKPAKKPRRLSSGDREVRPFTFQVVKKEG